MAKCAVVRQEDNVCINIIVAEATDAPQVGCFLVDVDNMFCNIGWIYDPVIIDFKPPPEVEET